MSSENKVMKKAVASLRSMASDKDCPDVKKDDLYKINPRVTEEEEGFNLRDYDDPDVIAQIEAFAHSYASGLYVPPWIVRTTAEGKIVPVEGHLRRRGALLAISRGAELPFVEAVRFNGNDAERVEVMLRSAEGLKLKVLDVAFGYLRLHRMGHSNAQIAKSQNKTPARVEQLLLVANANSDVHQLIRNGAVVMEAAIEAVREYREKAGDFLSGKLTEVQKQGGVKVTKSSLREPTLPPKVLKNVMASVQSVVANFSQATRVKLAEFENLEPAQLAGKTIEIDAAALLELVKAQAEVEDVKTKREEAAAVASAAAAQQELGGLNDGDAQKAA